MSDTMLILMVFATAGITGYVFGWVERGMQATREKVEIERLNYRLSTLEEDRLERDAEIERLREALSNLLAVTRQFLTDEPQKEAEKQAEAALAEVK